MANRDIWTVTAVSPSGALTVAPAGVTPTRAVPPGVAPGVTPSGVGERVLPAGYVTIHIELAYATTAHGVQGDTATSAHVVIGEHTGAASAYVGMTRGRTANTAHLVATDPAEARQQWMAVFGRDRADPGPGHAAQLVATEAARYAQPGVRGRSSSAVVRPLPGVAPPPASGDEPHRRLQTNRRIPSRIWRSAVTNGPRLAPSTGDGAQPTDYTGADHD